MFFTGLWTIVINDIWSWNGQSLARARHRPVATSNDDIFVVADVASKEVPNFRKSNDGHHDVP
jgi:hypothetical protein